MTILIIGISVISGVLGRLGGKEGYNTKFRDIGVSLAICLLVGLLGGKSLGFWGYMALLPAFLAQMGALTTYRYFLPKPKDYAWWHYALHGFFVALAIFPVILVTKDWFWFSLRCITSAVACGIWYFLAKWNDDLHEGGRYFLITLSTWLLLF